MANISYRAASTLTNRYGWNGGNEYEDEGELNYSNTFYRKYDAQIGRFTGIDMYAEKYAGMNPYQFGANNPVMFNDPMGDKLTGISKGPDGNYHADWLTGLLWANKGFYSPDHWGYDESGGGGGGGNYYDKMGMSSASVLSQMGFGQSFGINKNGDYGFWSSYSFRPEDRGYIGATKNGNTLAEVSVGSGRTWTPFPSFATLLSNYPLPYSIRPDRTPIDRRQPLDDVNGGNFRYFNQCAIRMSTALRRSGVNIAGAKNISNPGGQTYANGNIIGALNLATLLSKKSLLGNPISYDGTRVDIAALLSDKTGIIYFENFLEDDGSISHANTHIDLWDRGIIQGNFDIPTEASIIWFWEIR
jgi:RHS repeat-associated protein